MLCPNCQTEYKCPCRACTEHTPSGWKKINMSDDKNDWDEVCPTCGKCESIHWWFDEEYRQYELTKNNKIVTNGCDN